MTPRKRRQKEPQKSVEAEQPIDAQEPAEPQDPSESGVPGGGQGRTDLVGGSGVYPASASQRPPGDAPVRSQAEWGQGDRGAEGAADTGPSEVFFPGVQKEEVERARKTGKGKEHVEDEAPTEAEIVADDE